MLAESKEAASQSEGAPRLQAAPPESASRAQKIWAVLLVLDSFFVIIFGGALAAKLYQHWQTQPLAGAPAPRARRHEPPKAPAKEVPAPQPLAPKPVEPSLKQEAAAAPPAPAQAPGAPLKAKAAPVKFHIKAAKAKRVQLVGAFIVHGGKKDMDEDSDGVWGLTLYLTPNTYRYYFFVDGRKTPDPENSAADRGYSVMTVR